MYLLYPTVTRAAIRVISCSTPIDGVQYLTHDYSLACGTSQHRAFSILAWILLITFSAGFPFASFVLLFRLRHRLHEPKIQRRLLFLYSGVCVCVCVCVSVCGRVWVSHHRGCHRVCWPIADG